MSTTGNNISALRKMKGITQEELARAAGVSTQAVSKWECGGAPDLELLPAIADILEVSIDTLFGRCTPGPGGIESATAKYIASVEQAHRFSTALEHCWTIQRAIQGDSEVDENCSLEAINQKKSDHVYSQVLFDQGIALMSLKDELPYFFLMPEPANGIRTALPAQHEYQKLFALLGSSECLACLFLLYARQNKPFTPKLLVKELKLTAERACEVLESLRVCSFVHTSEIELDDEMRTVYHFDPNPAFAALLVFAAELIHRPHSFTYFSSNRSKPYLV